MTYLQLVNLVLVHLRENQVTTVSENTYSALIGVFINESKRQVEDAFPWDAMSTSISVNATVGTDAYVVTGSGLRHTGATINNITALYRLKNAPVQWIVDQKELSTVFPADPTYYCWSGNNGTDSKIMLFPTPNRNTTLKISLYVPQSDLSADADILLIPHQAVVAGAYARALVERGEDGGLISSEAYGLYRGILADQIALESTRYIENDSWSPA